MSPDEATLRRMALFWGTVPLYLASHPTIEGLLRAGCEAARKAGHIRSGDTVVVTAGVPLQVQGITNLIKVEKIP
jgi:pyruvate kinase